MAQASLSHCLLSFPASELRDASCIWRESRCRATFSVNGTASQLRGAKSVYISSQSLVDALFGHVADNASKLHEEFYCTSGSNLLVPIECTIYFLLWYPRPRQDLYLAFGSLLHCLLSFLASLPNSTTSPIYGASLVDVLLAFASGIRAPQRD